jgi:hypothetical protein
MRNGRMKAAEMGESKKKAKIMMRASAEKKNSI